MDPLKTTVIKSGAEPVTHVFVPEQGGAHKFTFTIKVRPGKFADTYSRSRGY